SLNYMQMDISKFTGDLEDENHFHMVTPPSSFGKEDQVVVSPEMLCLETSWCWPMEECGIHKVYSQFEDWLHGKAQSWYSADDFYDKSSIVSRK
ncbi:MAG: LruC domain-containing protein, partial [Duncaniella sp.]|nr:LruC domain-containing protein [Duncaniella sp.]